MFATTTRKREGGFTMVELLIAVLLTTVAMVGIIALFVSQNRAANTSRRSSEATALAIDKLEKLRTMSSPATGSDTVDVQGGSGGAFTRNWTVTAGSGYYDITVQVQWDDQSGSNTRKVTMVGRRGS